MGTSIWVKIYWNCSIKLDSTMKKGEKMKEELICKITDQDIGEIPTKIENPRLRLGARGMVIREDGKILERYLKLVKNRKIKGKDD